MAPPSFQRDFPAMGINCGIGIAGFMLSLVWRKATPTVADRVPVELLATVWIAITACGMVLALVL